MPVTFNIDWSRALARLERAQANVDRKRVERRLEKERLGLKDPTLRGTWTERRLCTSDPKSWTIAVPGRVGEVGELRDVAVESKSGRVAHCRGVMIVGHGVVLTGNPGWDLDPSLPRYTETPCTFLRSGRDLPADRPDLRALFTGGLGPGGVR